MNKETEDLISAFKQIDKVTNADIPSLQSINHNIKVHQEQKRAAYMKELILFICVACSLFVGGILLSFQAPVNIIIIQILGFIAVPFILSKDKKKIESERY